MYFQKLERVEFRDTDAAGIAHFSVFFNWMERTEHAFLRHLGWSVVSWESTSELGPSKISWPRVQAECNYRRPVSFEQIFGVQLEIVRLGLSSCTYQFRFLDPARVAELSLLPEHGFEPWVQGDSWFGADVEPFAQGQLTAVCCRIAAGGPPRSIEIAPSWRARLENFVSMDSPDQAKREHP